MTVAFKDLRSAHFDRRDILLNGLDKNSKILEIGASYNPAAPKRDGYRTYIVDHASRDELVSKYSSDTFDARGIEEVDFVWNGGALLDSIPEQQHRTFDLVIASQVIEHIPNPIRFLADIERILSPCGTLSLSVPDRRNCFDFFRPLTTAGDWLQALFENRAVHNVKTLYDEAAYIISSGEAASWITGQFSTPNFPPHGGVERGIYLFEQMHGRKFSQKYTDAHAWVFVPSSFILIVEELYKADMFGLRPIDVTVTGTYEIFVKMQSRPDTPAIGNVDRMSLLKAAAREQIEGLSALF